MSDEVFQIRVKCTSKQAGDEGLTGSYGYHSFQWTAKVPEKAWN